MKELEEGEGVRMRLGDAGCDEWKSVEVTLAGVVKEEEREKKQKQP